MFSIDRRRPWVWAFIGLTFCYVGFCNRAQSHHPPAIRIVPLSTVYPRSEIDLAMILEARRQPTVQVIAPGNRPFLGMVIDNAPLGAKVCSVVKAGPADRLGLRPGDKIVRFDDLEIDSPSDLVLALSLTVLGKPAKIDVLRHNSPITRTICFLPEPATLPAR